MSKAAPPSKKFSKYVYVRMTPGFKRRVQKAAAKRKLSDSDFMRAAAEQVMGQAEPEAEAPDATP